MGKKKPFRVTKWLGFLMVSISLIGFYGLSDAERVSRSAWQLLYMIFIFGGGIFNILDSGGGFCSKFSCLSYFVAVILSAFIGSKYRGGIHPDTYLIIFAFITSALRLWMVWGHNSIEQKSSENIADVAEVQESRVVANTHKIIKTKKELEEDAYDILEDVKWNSDEVNKSLTVFDFIYSYKRVIDGLNELVKLNEIDGVSMTPPPRKDLEEIQGGIELIIDKFIDRAMIDAQMTGESEVEFRLKSMTEDETFWNLATYRNKGKINRILCEIEQNRRRINEQLKQKQEKEAKDKILNSIGLEPNVDCSTLDPMEVINAMESKIESFYKLFKNSAHSPETGERMFLSFKSSCETSKLPLAAEVRLESLLNEYEPKFHVPDALYFVDHMSGAEFEQWCADLLERTGFAGVEVTRGSGDQGVDVLAEKDGIKYAFQCKCYSSDLGNKPVQEVHAGKYIYQCHVGVVITNRYFTQGAKDAAKATGILLWDRDKLREMMEAVAQ